ncbi:MAG: hypothetical protein LBU95_04685 [Rikenellaceae bacterium]|jgi:hypothetical protein|nr:hypothetical protein [Rikenellaceae bacterium]
MPEEQSIDPIEFLLLAAYLGSVVFVAGSAAFGYLAFKRTRRRPGALAGTAGLVLLQLLLAFALAVAGWVWWPFGFDVMLGPVLLPALAAEALTVPLFLTFMCRRGSPGCIN